MTFIKVALDKCCNPVNGYTKCTAYSFLSGSSRDSSTYFIDLENDCLIYSTLEEEYATVSYSKLHLGLGRRKPALQSSRVQEGKCPKHARNRMAATTSCNSPSNDSRRDNSVQSSPHKTHLLYQPQ
jgi:hypothetical protein